MRKSLPQKIEACRIKKGPLASDSSYGINGFLIPYKPCTRLEVIVFVFVYEIVSYVTGKIMRGKINKGKE